MDTHPTITNPLKQSVLLLCSSMRQMIYQVPRQSKEAEEAGRNMELRDTPRIGFTE